MRIFLSNPTLSIYNIKSHEDFYHVKHNISSKKNGKLLKPLHEKSGLLHKIFKLIISKLLYVCLFNNTYNKYK